MLSQLSIEANKRQTRSPSHVRPDYGQYNFASVPGAILNLFDIDTSNRFPSRILPDDGTIEKVIFPGISDVFMRTQSGRPIVPAGSCRSFFLYVREDTLDETVRQLKRRLDGVAQVMRVDRLIQQGYFGLPVSDRFLSRAGNVVIVPDRGKSVWWYEPGRFETASKGVHGGLTQDEMLIPLLALRL